MSFPDDLTPEKALAMGPIGEGCTVQVHAFETDEDGNESHVESDTPDARGCVWIRTEPDSGGMFDSVFELDFPDYASAEAFADQYAERHGLEVFPY